MKKDEQVKPSAEVSPQTEPISQTIENAHATGDGTIAKSDEDLPDEEKNEQGPPAY